MGRSAGIAALFLALAAAGAWFLVSSANREAPPAAPGQAAAPVPAAAPPSAAPTAAHPATAGVVEGIVTREGKPCAARITAFRTHPAPTEGNTVEDWRAVMGGWEGIPEAGAEVLATTEAGPDGRWSLRGLDACVAHFEAETVDGARGGREDAVGPGGTIVEGARWGEPGPVSIEIQPGTCVLRGRVVQADGTAWSGLVWVGGDAYESDRPPPLRTGADGTFRIRGLPKWTVSLHAGEPCRRTSRGPDVLLPFDGEVTFTLGAGTREVPGVVVEAANGRPVAGATVRVSGLNDNWSEESLERITSDGSGRFLAHPAVHGSFEVEVEADGFVLQKLIVGAEEPAKESLEIRLHRGASVSGRVLEEGTGKPVPGIEVLAYMAWNHRSGSSTGSASDAEGRYAIRDLPPGEHIVVAFSGGWASRGLGAPGGWSASEETLTLAGAGAVAKDLFVVRAPRIQGRVVDGEGRGVPGVTVEVDVDWKSGGTAGEVLMLLSFETRRENLVSGPDGGFELPHVLPGVAYRFLAKRGKWEVAAAGPVAALPGETAEVVLRIPAERRITVKVLDAETGEPLAGVDVNANAKFFPRRSDSLGGENETGADGSVELGPLPALPFEVYVAGYVGHHEGVTVTVDATETGTVELRVEREPASNADLPPIEGRVLFPDGTPAVGASVEAHPKDEASACRFGPGNRTDFLGRFRESRFQPGMYEMTASLSRGGQEFSTGAEVEEGVREVVLRLRDQARIDAGLEEEEPGPRLRVRVLGPGGKPIPGGRAMVHFLFGEEEDSDDRTIFEGLSSIPFPDGGEVERLWVEIAIPYSEGRPLPLAHGLFGPFDGGTREVEVRLSAESVLEGRVLDPEGKGVSDIGVNATPTYSEVAGGDSWNRDSVANARTDAQGRFRIGGLAAREYEVDLDVASGRGFSPADSLLARPGGGEVEFRLRGAVDARVQVLDFEGRPVGGAMVFVNGPGGFSQSEEADWTGSWKGSALLRGLDPDAEYSLHINPPETRDDLVRRDLRGWKPAETEVALGKGRVVVVRVKDLAGGPVEGVEVDCRGKSVRTGKNGVARFPRIPFVPVHVTAAFPDFPGGPTADAVVDEESERLDLVLDPGVELRLRVAGAKNQVSAFYARSGADTQSGNAISEGGEFRVRGLRAEETCDFYFREHLTENCAVLRGVRPGGETVTVTLAEGTTIRGRVHFGEDDAFDRVAVLVGNAPLIEADEVDREGNFVITGVPPGRWKLLAVAAVDGKMATRTAEVDAGGTVELKFR